MVMNSAFEDVLEGEIRDFSDGFFYYILRL